MTVRGLLLALAILTASPVESAALCHRYSVWKYPFPQSCKAAGHGMREMAHRPLAPSGRVARITPTVGGQGFSPSSLYLSRRHDDDIPLPALDRADFTAAAPDEVTAARLELLGYAYAH